MRRYQVIQKPIFIDVLEIVAIGDSLENRYSSERKCTLENGQEITMTESENNKVEIGKTVVFSNTFGGEYIFFNEDSVKEKVDIGHLVLVE